MSAEEPALAGTLQLTASVVSLDAIVRSRTAPGTASSLWIVIVASLPCAWRRYASFTDRVPGPSASRSSILSSASTSASSVIDTVRFCVFGVAGPNVTDFVAMPKSVFSVAVLPPSTSMAKVVDWYGSASTVTGTFSVSPVTFSATARVCVAVAAAFEPIAICACRCPIMISNLATALSLAVQPAALVPSCSPKHSPRPTRSSPFFANVKLNDACV